MDPLEEHQLPNNIVIRDSLGNTVPGAKLRLEEKSPGASADYLKDFIASADTAQVKLPSDLAPGKYHHSLHNSSWRLSFR
jgi:hypothetical protein